MSARRIVLFAGLVAALVPGTGGSQDQGPSLSPLPDPPPINREKADLGRLLFFDPRLSGDASLSCATCHLPDRAFSDGERLSKGYPGGLYFRRTPTLYGVAFRRRLYWDGRFDGRDLDSLVRDHIAEAHFMNADGRLVIERLRQVPLYEQTFRSVMGGEPSYGKILGAVAEFVRTLRTDGGAIDRFLQTGGGLAAPAARGHELFTGQAGCVRCHHGPMLTDESFHALGVPENAEVFANPLRHIVFRRFFATLGVGGYAHLRTDVGRYAITKDPRDRGRFRTPSLREVGTQAAFMHNGAFTSLAQVVDFYDRGGGEGPNRAEELRPLGLPAEDKAALVLFLQSLTGRAPAVEVPRVAHPYQVRPLGRAGEPGGAP